MKERRQRASLTLIATRPIRSQEELAALLESKGYETTQATISRDIKELGLAKVPLKDADGQQFKYVLPNATINFASRLHRVVSEVVLDIAGSVNLIVLHTHPGSAMMAAAAVDEAGWDEVIGTIGGDDTILVILRAPADLPVVMQRFADLKVAAAS
ncbi:MAG: arginine repressor [Candidatus Eremiobacteraeota bacterium]|nr:arginine repressor [Candidatus Eremiobacteraeota bacterium]